jgi:hypothetical protein
VKRRPCKVGQCPYPAAKGRQFCEWHVLLRSSSDKQAAASRARLERSNAENPGMPKVRVSKEFWPEGERWCAGCQSFVPLFYCSGSRCKACASMAAHAARLEKVYGIDADEYARIFAKQGGRCAICRNKPRSIRFAVDHDHQTGEVRGILCKRCNHDLLGGAHDSVETLWAAMVYLLDPPAQRVGGRSLTQHELEGLLRARLFASRTSPPVQRVDLQEPPF